MDLTTHAANSANIRLAAELAGEISEYLMNINSGSPWECDNTKSADHIDGRLRSLARLLGYEVERAR
jgi:hypothetical protein